MSELHYTSIIELSTRLRKRDLSPVEVTQYILDRIEVLDDHLNAFVTTMPDLAIAQARHAEDEFMHDRSRGILQGIPIGLKDIIATRDAPTNVGSTALINWHSGHDATVTSKLRSAGSVLLGKLKTTEGAYAAHHPSIKPPINPWNIDYWTGTSSSGPGVATATGLCFGSLGSDTGGSIRFPAFCCGIVGMKPTWGRVSRHGVFPLAETMDHVGPFARTVADTAAILNVIAGPDLNDTTSSRELVPDYLDLLTEDITDLRIGFDRQYATEGVSPVIAGSMIDAMEIFRQRGANIKPVQLPAATEAIHQWLTICAAEASVSHEEVFPEHSEKYNPLLRGLLNLGSTILSSSYVKAQTMRQKFRIQMEALFEHIDVLVTPAWHQLTPTLHILSEQLKNDGSLEDLIRFSAPQDLSGNPTLSLPSGFDENGLPFGFQLVGNHFKEQDLFRVGHTYQKETTWHRNHPHIGR